ncbi:MAG: peptidoglycan-associated lipoprotein Pal [Candidatus Magnetoovum sp. WYHC-5]|nr:peptidoglycan-associated lipoprotein Pal [Candidatus Magnetoovum sp. WYHC-5]
MKKSILLILVVFLLMSCAEKKGIVHDDQMGGGALEGEMDGSGADGEYGSESALGKDRVDGSDLEENGFGGTLSEQEWKARTSEIFTDVLFGFNRYDVSSEYQHGLNAMADFLAAQSKGMVKVEGHCDERGTREYNIALGDQRAQSVKNYLVSLGVSGARISTVSYGKERPMCKEHNERCWALNRRAHFEVTR